MKAKLLEMLIITIGLLRRPIARGKELQALDATIDGRVSTRDPVKNDVNKTKLFSVDSLRGGEFTSDTSCFVTRLKSVVKLKIGPI
jgi:hypothetical protein